MVISRFSNEDFSLWYMLYSVLGSFCRLVRNLFTANNFKIHDNWYDHKHMRWTDLLL